MSMTAKRRILVVPPEGVRYQTPHAARRAWEAGADFFVLTREGPGRRTNKALCEQDPLIVHVDIRYDGARHAAVKVAHPEKP